MREQKIKKTYVALVEGTDIDVFIFGKNLLIFVRILLKLKKKLVQFLIKVFKVGQFMLLRIMENMHFLIVKVNFLYTRTKM